MKKAGPKKGLPFSCYTLIMPAFSRVSYVYSVIPSSY